MTAQDMTPEELLARVLHRDGLMLVIDKPSGIAVHRHPRKADGCLEDYFDALRYGLPRNPSLAHRLDLFGPAGQGRESSPVGRPDFKSGWGSETVPGGFDSHSLPPEKRRG